MNYRKKNQTQKDVADKIIAYPSEVCRIEKGNLLTDLVADYLEACGKVAIVIDKEQITGE